MSRFADLHMHTHHSDGIDAPLALVDRAASHELSIIAISDHDNLAAFEEVREHAAARNIELIPAAELSCQYDGIDVHILAYGIDPANQRLQSRLADFRETRRRRGERMVERIAALGYDLDIERVRQLCKGESMGRPHVARALIEIGAVDSMEQAFEMLLGQGRPGWVDKERFTIAEAVSLVSEAGGVSSVAHPTLYRDHQRIVPELLDLGVDGIEAFHPQVDEPWRGHYQRLAGEQRVLVTGGSDDHGEGERLTMGTVRIPENVIRPLLRAIGR